jgi:hypothetical protein
MLNREAWRAKREAARIIISHTTYASKMMMVAANKKVDSRKREDERIRRGKTRN